MTPRFSLQVAALFRPVSSVSSICLVEHRVEKIELYLACTDPPNAMLVRHPFVVTVVDGHCSQSPARCRAGNSIVVCRSVELNACRQVVERNLSGNQSYRSNVPRPANLTSSNRFHLIAHPPTSLPGHRGPSWLATGQRRCYRCKPPPVGVKSGSRSRASCRPPCQLTVFMACNLRATRSLVIFGYPYFLFFVSLNSLQTAITAHTVTRSLASSRRRELKVGLRKPPRSAVVGVQLAVAYVMASSEAGIARRRPCRIAERSPVAAHARR